MDGLAPQIQAQDQLIQSHDQQIQPLTQLIQAQDQQIELLTQQHRLLTQQIQLLPQNRVFGFLKSTLWSIACVAMGACLALAFVQSPSSFLCNLALVLENRERIGPGPLVVRWSHF